MGRRVFIAAIFAVLLAFGMVTIAAAADFYIVKDAAGKMVVTDKKPEDVKSIVKGPFKNKAEAENAMKSEPPTKKLTPPAEGC
jgi:hypothetical protein